MAMFHFRIKSDKKPDGTKVSAFKHVEYIRREGNFAEVEQWKVKNKFGGCFITPTVKIPTRFEMFQINIKFFKAVFGFIVVGVIFHPPRLKISSTDKIFSSTKPMTLVQSVILKMESK